jgi:hypothetical protein
LKRKTSYPYPKGKTSISSHREKGSIKTFISKDITVRQRPLPAPATSLGPDHFLLEKGDEAGHWRLTPVILATQEAEIRRMVV